MSALCAFIAWLPVKSGIRIPVHCDNGKMGYIDETGRMVLAPLWTYATEFEADGKSCVSRDPEHAWRMDREGRMSPYQRAQHQKMSLLYTPSEGDINYQIKDDPIAVCRDRKWGFTDRNGGTVIPFKWRDTRGFDGNGHATVAGEGGWGVINVAGDLIVPLKFEYLERFDDKGMCAAAMANNWGFIDTQGETVIPFEYSAADSFDRFGMARVVKRDPAPPKTEPVTRAGWIDRSGKVVIPLVYKGMPPQWHPNFQNHELLPFRDAKGSGLLDRTGKVVVPPGTGGLYRVSDPIAPGRYWITRERWNDPDKTVSHPPPFKPACYTSDGTLIWSGSCLTRGYVSAILSGTFALLAAGSFLISRRYLRKSAAARLEPQT